MLRSLPINIESLLNGKAVESNRLEFKKGWNPDAIYRTICAFANDFDNTGGGYIVVGVEEKNGKAMRPVAGIDSDRIESIEKEMIGFNNLINPYYQPSVFIEEVDDRNIVVIKVSAGERRPYKVPEQITSKHKTYNYYIRYNSSTIIAKDDYERELMNLANRTPFDDRGNPNIELNDLSAVLIRDFLVAVGSKLANEDLSANLMNVLEQMDLVEGYAENRCIKNVAAMMFSEHPEKFFNTTQVDIVIFPEGREKNPNNMVEIEPIKGSVPDMIRKTLDYMKINVVKKSVFKPKDNEQSVIFFNYPYQALEEAVVNALYHRDYQEREPVEITIEPDKITILSYSGPDNSISMNSIKSANILRSRRYRNRRLGEFLKELGLTEGRATGIPTIQAELKVNGSQRASIETDDRRTYFLIDIPCHPQMIGVDIFAEADDLEGNLLMVYTAVKSNTSISLAEIAVQTGLSIRTVSRCISKLKKIERISRTGQRKSGSWVILK